MLLRTKADALKEFRKNKLKQSTNFFLKNKAILESEYKLRKHLQNKTKIGFRQTKKKQHGSPKDILGFHQYLPFNLNFSIEYIFYFCGRRLRKIFQANEALVFTSVFEINGDRVI